MQFIYGLTDPLSQSVRYVGKTDNPMRRYKQHCRADDESTKSIWIRGLKSAKLLPGLVILETVDCHAWVDDREKYWIWYYLDQGAELVNGVSLYRPITRKIPKRVIPKGKIGELLMFAYTCKVNKEGKYSFSQLARDTGFLPGYIHRILHGKNLPSREVLLLICKVLGCDLNQCVEIFELTDYRNPTQAELDEVAASRVA